MNNVLYLVLHFWWAIAIVAFLLLLISYKLVLRMFGVVIIPEDSIGIVNKKYCGHRRNA